MFRTPTPSPIPGNNLVVLIVDDNNTNRKVAERIFLHSGVAPENIYLAEDGVEAIACVERRSPQRFDIILMDSSMPLMKGEDATKAIRALEQQRGLRPSIIVTCSTDYEGVFPGANIAVKKPLMKAEIVKLVENVIQEPAQFFAPEPSVSADSEEKITTLYQERAVKLLFSSTNPILVIDSADVPPESSNLKVER